MQSVPISAVPNQDFTIILDGNTWDITLKTTDGIISASLNLNSIDIVDNARVVSGSYIIQEQYQESGNFFFLTQNQELPLYTQFNVTQSLIYISAAELAALRVPPPPPITEAYFNPLGALPLRFSPRNYF